VGFFSLPPRGVWSTFKALGDIMELDLVQWGNSQGDGTVKGTTCQHGPPECKTMAIYACHKYTHNTTAHAEFLECFDQILIKTFPKGLPEGAVNLTFAESSLSVCAAKQGIDYKTLNKCATGPEGAKYFAQEKAKTPKHTGVPFVSVNGAPILYNNGSLNLIVEVCNAYKGSPKPKACSNRTLLADASMPMRRGAEVLPTAYTSLFQPVMA